RRSDVLRDGESGGLVLISPKGMIDAFPVEFRWKAPPQADAFKFELIDDRLATVIPETGTNERTFSLPIGYEPKIQPGRTYIWSVKAMDDLDHLVGSAQRSFTIRVKD
ncbi:MAG: hypothetical protein PHI34_09885, partial [Acidobacteriota bacterium]|nr:hypothetical protein [Acidobacteriota bacterium]